MKKISLILLITLGIANLSSAQSYLIENQLNSDYCNQIRVDIHVFTSGTVCPPTPPGSYQLFTYNVGPGGSATYTFNANEYVGRVVATSNSLSCLDGSLNTCTTGSTTFQEEDKGSNCTVQNNCQVVTLAADATNGAQIY